MYVNKQPQKVNCYQTNLVTDGDFIVLKVNPGPASPLEKVKNFVNHQFENANISTWKPAQENKQHITLFMGLNKGMTQKERESLLTIISRKLANKKQYHEAIDLKTTKVKLGPGKYVTLQFRSQKITHLAKRVQKAIKYSFKNGLVRPEVINQQKLNALGNSSNFHPHITLGVVSDDPTHPDQMLLQGTNDFKKSFGSKYKAAKKQGVLGDKIVLDRDRIHLLGVEDLQVSNKKYIDLATISLGQKSEQRFRRPRPVKSTALPRLQHVNRSLTISNSRARKDATSIIRDKMLGLCNYDSHMDVKRSKDEKGKQTFRVTFEPSELAKKNIKEALGDDVAFHKARKVFIQVGEKRLKKLFGESEGVRLFQKKNATSNIRDKMLGLCNYDPHTDVKKSKDEKGKQTFRVTFEPSELAKKNIKQALGDDVVFHKAKKVYIQVGEKRLKKLFGESKGLRLIQTL